MSHRLRLLCPLAVVLASMVTMGALQPAFAATSNGNGDRSAQGLLDRSLCIFDPIGANGPIYHAMQRYITQALRWGVRFHPRAYTSEAVAAADFKTGKCDAMVITGVRNIHFVKFSGSLDMAGGLQSYKGLHLAIRVMSSAKAAKYMRQGAYETVGVMPAGKVYLYAQKKHYLDSLKQAAGKEIAVMGFDKQAKVLVQEVGAAPVPSTIATFGPKFNNGSVDYAYAPAIAYEAMELYKGLGEKGGIADFVLGMLSYQIVIHWKRFPEGFGQKSRQWVLHNMYQPAMRRIRQAEAGIPDDYWVHISGKRETKYRDIFRRVRQRLWEANWYSHTTQRLLKKIRCHLNPALAECSAKTEGGPV